MRNTSKLTLVKRRAPEPPAALVKKALDMIMLSDLSDCANELEIARTMWRRHRNLVEAPEFPENLRVAFVDCNGHEPSDDCGLADDAMEPGYRESQVPLALETARHWMQRDGGKGADGVFLQDLAG